MSSCSVPAIMHAMSHAPKVASSKYVHSADTPRTSGAVATGRQAWWWILLIVVSVGSLTFGQTTLSIVGQAPEFFVANRLSPLEILLVAALVVTTPLVLAIPVLAFRFFSEWLAGMLLAVILGLLAAVLALYTLDRYGLSTGGSTFGAVVVAVLVSLVYLRYSTARSFVRFLAPAPIAILLMFAFASPTAALIFSDEESGAPIKSPVADIPIVLIIFDEFPLTAIMDGSGRLVSDELHAFRKLAEDGVWYRNAVTNSHQTFYAVPSIMTGTRPSRELLPIAAHHPDSLFSAFSNSHHLRVMEPFTAICAAQACTESTGGILDRLSSVFRDLQVVGLHIITPESLSEELPPIDQAWAGFSASSTVSADQLRSEFLEQSRQDRRIAVARFIDMIEEPSTRPPLLFGHFLLPHSPWEYLADGTGIGRAMPPTFEKKITVDDPWRISLGVQRLLHTVGFLDNSLASMLNALDGAGMYDSALIIVVSDHGASFVPGFHRRQVVPDNMTELLPIPLLVKYPAELAGMPAAGTIDDFRAETIDIMPTILDVLGTRSPYPVDGVSLLDLEARSRRSESVIPTENGELVYPAGLEPALEASARYDLAFPTRNPNELIPFGADRTLIGAEPEVVDVEDITITMRNPERYEGLRLEEEPFPAVATARVEGVEPEQLVGIVVNGRIVALTQVHANDDGISFASGIIPKDALEAGDNDVNMVVIQADGSVQE